VKTKDVIQYGSIFFVVNQRALKMIYLYTKRKKTIVLSWDYS